MGSYKVVFSETASRDLEKIVRFIAKDDSDVAERFGFELAEKALSLENKYIREAGMRFIQRKGCQKLNLGVYLIIYRVIESQQKVRILRFWHGAKDRKNL